MIHKKMIQKRNMSTKKKGKTCQKNGSKSQILTKDMNNSHCSKKHGTMHLTINGPKLAPTRHLSDQIYVGGKLPPTLR